MLRSNPALKICVICQLTTEQLNAPLVPVARNICSATPMLRRNRIFAMLSILAGIGAPTSQHSIGKAGESRG